MDLINLYEEIKWFDEYLTESVVSFVIAKKENKTFIPKLNQAPVIEHRDAYGRFIEENCLSKEERLVLILTIMPYILPEVLGNLEHINDKTKMPYSEFGCGYRKVHQGFIPTVQTALFLIAGQDYEKKADILSTIFQPDNVLFGKQALYIQHMDTDEPYISGILRAHWEFVDWVTTGKIRKPEFSERFPAKLLTTEQTWDDLILPDHILQNLEEIKLWIKHEKELMHGWGLDMKVKPGYKSLFYGFPGTGKSFAAALIGKSTGRDVYRIDLSLMVSKWVGETEKNLSRVFDKAANKDWILFFDEADSLFGQRSKVNNSQDRYGNQGVSYLLQRIEDYPGVVLMATNLKSNLDDAFYRRFHSVIHFPRPKAHERWLIWKRTFETLPKLKPDADLRALANGHDINGSNIINAVRYASLMAISQGSKSITHEGLEQGIIKEKKKEGKML